jgi:hypothetical protein
MESPAGYFSEDHPVEMLRGQKRPTRAKAVRKLRARAEWLHKKWAERLKGDLNTSALYREEVAVVALAIELLERSELP